VEMACAERERTAREKEPSQGLLAPVPDAVGATTPGESWVGWSEAGRDEEKPADPGASGMTWAARGRGYDGSMSVEGEACLDGIRPGGRIPR
jgi:hypothetical protein